MQSLTTRGRILAAAGTLRYATVAVALLVGVTGCGTPAEGKVTFKVVERAHKEESCGGVPLMCTDESVPTAYRVEVTYFDTDLDEERDCWFNVDPHTYSDVAVGDPVKLSVSGPMTGGCMINDGFEGWGW